MLKSIDDVLNRITMYRLSVALVFAITGVLHYDPFALLFSIGFLLTACWLTNWIFARIFDVPTNVESVYISALILALIITPLQSTQDLWFLGWAAVWAMASKYIIAPNKRHIFNPVAFAVALTYFTLNQSASWWVGNGPLLPFVLIGGLLVVRKIRRFELVFSFLSAALIMVLTFSFFNGDDFIATLQNLIAFSPLLFFACVILTEPLTTPPTRNLRIVYGLLVGFLFTPDFHIGAFYTTPEIAILIGNVFSYLVSPKTTLMLQLKQKVQLAPDVYDFIFAPARKFAFAPGQYMEWTLGYHNPDSRGNRRYFTLASSPTEDNLRLGVKFYEKSSTFKQALLSMDRGTAIVASHLAGDFVLPNSPNQKCVFIAGGIGITPFRSMIKYLLDTRQHRPLVLFYVNRTIDDIVYKDVFDKAQQRIGLKVIYTLTDTNRIPAGWTGEIGHITPRLIKAEVPDYQKCVFYISGPPRLVESLRDLLDKLNVPSNHIKTDFFLGLA
jgi:ferredoxin-NADP reductase